MPDKYYTGEYELTIAKELTVAMISTGRLTNDEDVSRFLRITTQTINELLHGVQQTA